MACKKRFCDALRIALGFFKDGELVRVDRLIFVNAGLNVPASEVSTVGARKSAGAESTDRRTLPVAIVDVTAVQRRRFRAGIFEGLADGTLPGCFGDVVVSGKRGNCEQECRNYQKASTREHSTYLQTRPAQLAGGQGMGQPEGCPGV